jgi:hypothetical protein
MSNEWVRPPDEIGDPYPRSFPKASLTLLRLESPLSHKLILVKKHIFGMLCWMRVGIFIIMPGIDESTEV